MPTAGTTGRLAVAFRAIRPRAVGTRTRTPLRSSATSDASFGAALREDDADSFLGAAVAVLEWGRVRRSERRLRALGARAVDELTETARRLDPAEADLHRLSEVSLINSGFSKIYSLLLEGFPIYDSRVACALASLVRLFCEETGRGPEVPTRSRSAFRPARHARVVIPPAVRCVFPKIWTPRRYAESNLMAAWLLDVLSQQSPFAELASERQRALQSAMFMVGYTVYRGPE